MKSVIWSVVLSANTDGCNEPLRNFKFEFSALQMVIVLLRIFMLEFSALLMVFVQTFVQIRLPIMAFCRTSSHCRRRPRICRAARRKNLCQ